MKKKILVTICITGILVKVMTIKAVELPVPYRGKHPQVFTQNCHHLHMYGKKHSRANPESGNDYLKIQISKGFLSHRKP